MLSGSACPTSAASTAFSCQNLVKIDHFLAHFFVDFFATFWPTFLSTFLQLFGPLNFRRFSERSQPPRRAMWIGCLYIILYLIIPYILYYILRLLLRSSERVRDRTCGFHNRVRGAFGLATICGMRCTLLLIRWPHSRKGTIST